MRNRLDMNIKEYRAPNLAILYNEDLLREFSPLIFHRCAIKRAGQVSCTGRGETFFFRHRDTELVHKRYQRGGLYRFFVKETYLYLSLPLTRMWQEFNLLTRMHHGGLPVPEPVAVRCYRCKGFGYRGDLITRRIDQADTLAGRLLAGPLPGQTWRRIGRTIRAFHEACINHADLNAGNIMIDAKHAVWLIDFDKSRVESQAAGEWQEGNLSRLLKSLNKMRGRHPCFFFNRDDWRELLAGYHAGGEFSGLQDFRNQEELCAGSSAS